MQSHSVCCVSGVGDCTAFMRPSQYFTEQEVLIFTTSHLQLVVFDIYSTTCIYNLNMLCLSRSAELDLELSAFCRLNRSC